jgi:hypothetical protein
MFHHPAATAAGNAAARQLQEHGRGKLDAEHRTGADRQPALGPGRSARPRRHSPEGNHHRHAHAGISPVLVCRYSWTPISGQRVGNHHATLWRKVISSGVHCVADRRGSDADAQPIAFPDAQPLALDRGAQAAIRSAGILPAPALSFVTVSPTPSPPSPRAAAGKGTAWRLARALSGVPAYNRLLMECLINIYWTLGAGFAILVSSKRSGGGFSSDLRAELVQADLLHVSSAARSGCFASSHRR